VILCSAKTRAEQQPIRADLNITAPYIVENGSAIIIPDETLPVEPDSIKYPVERRGGEIVIRLGMPHDDIQQQLEDIRLVTGIDFKSYDELSLDDIMQITGLSREGAKRARQREYSSTIVTQLDSIDAMRFQAACSAHQLKAPSGGRFMTITNSRADKGAAVKLLTQLYQAQLGDVKKVGIGDSPNDLPMLTAVDIPYLVQRPEGKWRKLDVAGLRRVPAVGPAGFSLMVKHHFK